MKKRFAEKQIIGILKEPEALGTSGKPCHKQYITEQTFQGNGNHEV